MSGGTTTRHDWYKAVLDIVVAPAASTGAPGRGAADPQVQAIEAEIDRRLKWALREAERLEESSRNYSEEGAVSEAFGAAVDKVNLAFDRVADKITGTDPAKGRTAGDEASMAWARDLAALSKATTGSEMEGAKRLRAEHDAIVKERTKIAALPDAAARLKANQNIEARLVKLHDEEEKRAAAAAAAHKAYYDKGMEDAAKQNAAKRQHEEAQRKLFDATDPQAQAIEAEIDRRLEWALREAERLEESSRNYSEEGAVSEAFGAAVDKVNLAFDRVADKITGTDPAKGRTAGDEASMAWARDLAALSKATTGSEMEGAKRLRAEHDAIVKERTKIAALPDAAARLKANQNIEARLVKLHDEEEKRSAAGKAAGKAYYDEGMEEAAKRNAAKRQHEEEQRKLFGGP